MNWKSLHSVWALGWRPRKTRLGVQTLCMALLLCLASPIARADCPAAPIGDPDDMAISFLAAHGVQAASASLLASSVKEGTLIYDDSAQNLKVCNGSNWMDVGAGADTLAALACAAGQIAKYNGAAWACAADGGGGGSGSAASYLHASGPALANVAVGSVLPFNSAHTSAGSDITLNTGNNRFTVKAGKTYRLMGQMLINQTSPTGALWYRWYNVNSGTEIGTGGYSMTTDHTATYSSAPLAVAYVTPAADTAIELRIISASPATTMDVYLSYAWIEALGGGSDTLAGLSCATNEIPKWNGTIWECAADGGGGGGSGVGLEYFAGSALLAGNLNYHNVTPTNNYPVTVPSGTKAVKLAVHYNHNSGTTGTHGYLGFLAYQKGQTAANKKVSYFSQHYDDYANSDIAYLDIPWDDSLDDQVTIQVTSSYNTDPLNIYSIYFGGYVVVGGGSDTLAGLSCTTGQIPSWNGSAWECADMAGGGVPAGTIAAFAATTCPAGWTEYVAARGRFLRGIDNGAGNDPAGTRAPGNVQLDKVGPHTHDTSGNRIVTDSGGVGLQSGANRFWNGNFPVVANTILSGGDVETRPKNVAVIFCQYSGSGGGGGGAAEAAGDAGEIQFNDGTDAFAADAGLVWDNVNKRLGIGTTTPQAALEVNGNIRATSPVYLTDASNLESYLDLGGGLLRGTAMLFNSPWAASANALMFGLSYDGTESRWEYAVGAGATYGSAWRYDATEGSMSYLTTGDNQGVNGENAQDDLEPRFIINRTGQMGIGTATPAATALLELASTTKGFLPPRMNDTQRDAITTPATGLMIFNTTAGQFQFWSGTAWNGLGGSGVPTGTIAAFALTTCPAGWTEYVAARGRFLRGIDNGAGNDPDGTRAPGNVQADALQNITGSLNVPRARMLGATSTGAFDHTSAGSLGATGDTQAGLAVTFDASRVARTADETRPKNVAVLFCQYSGSGGSGGGATTLAGLTDVDASAIGNGKVLTYNSTTSKWEASTPSAGAPAGSAGALQFRGSSAVFAADDANLIWDNTNKRLGIGTATPERPLHIQVDASGSPTMIALENVNTAGSTAVVSHRITTTGVGANTFVEATGIQMKAVQHDHATRTSQISFWTSANGTYDSRMIIDGSGNVGIGTTTPTQRLHIEGGQFLVSPGSGGYATTFTGLAPSAIAIGKGINNDEFARLTFGNGTEGNYAGIGTRVTVNGSFLYLGTSNNYANGITNEALVITPAGNVGVGTASPSAKLDVTGKVAATSFGLNVTRVTASTTAIGNKSAIATCAANYTLTGGGCQAPAWGGIIVQNYPNTATSWSCAATDAYGTAQTLTAYAVCVKTGP